MIATIEKYAELLPSWRIRLFADDWRGIQRESRRLLERIAGWTMTDSEGDSMLLVTRETRFIPVETASCAQVEHGWVVCAPGDPNSQQRESAYMIAGSDHVCFTEWNADTESVRASIWRWPLAEVIWEIDASGNAEYVGRIEGESL